MDYYKAVEDFHRMLDLPVAERPTNIDRASFARRIRLINEELSEYCKAVSNDDIVGIADGLGDLLYVVFGAAVEHGLPMDTIFSQIQTSNMTKRDGYMDAGGKWVKPDNYVPVDLSWLMGDNEE